MTKRGKLRAVRCRAGVRTNITIITGLKGLPMSHWTEDLIPRNRARTLDGLFYQRVQRSAGRVAYRWFDRASNGWRSLTWADTATQVARWRAALAAEGLQAGERVAVLLRNGPEWVIFDQAALGLGLVTVPLYTDDRPESAAYVLGDSGTRLMLVQDVNRWRRLAEVIREGAAEYGPGPARIVLLDDGTGARELAAADPRVVVAAAWLPATAPPLTERTDADPHALATIVYTSGTTGRAKGVMLSHDAILSNAYGCCAAIRVYQQDSFLSFLPLSHMLERTGSYYLPMLAGASVAYARSVSQLAEDLQNVRPTVMIAVPRVFERVYTRLQAQVAGRSPAVKRLFALANRTGWLHFEYTQGRRRWHPLLLLWPFLRRKVAKPVLDRLGGRLRAAVSGGAPLPLEVARLFVGLGVPLLQGYGLTETSPVVSVNPLEDNRPDSVGVPLQDVSVRIGEDDELLVRGPSVMQGYWNNPEATARVLDADGWFRTGDQARIDGRHIWITGRIKDVLVLSNGEKVPPADMEMSIALDPLVEQVLVIGEGRSYLTALVVLSPDQWPGLAAHLGLDPDAPESLDDPALHREMLHRVREALSEFPGYAKVRRITLSLEPWSVENGLLTPTMKTRRAQVIARYQAQVEQMYHLEA